MSGATEAAWGSRSPSRNDTGRGDRAGIRTQVVRVYTLPRCFPVVASSSPFRQSPPPFTLLTSFSQLSGKIPFHCKRETEKWKSCERQLRLERLKFCLQHPSIIHHPSICPSPTHPSIKQRQHSTRNSQAPMSLTVTTGVNPKPLGPPNSLSRGGAQRSSLNSTEHLINMPQFGQHQTISAPLPHPVTMTTLF